MERTNTMNALDIMKRPAAYVSGYENTPTEEQNRAKQLCWEYNRTAPNEQEKRRSILQTLLGTCSPMTGIEPDFHCDYGFNIHTHGLAVINYNCVILDTSPVNIGAGAFIAPGVCLACSGHAIDPEQRSHGIGTHYAGGKRLDRRKFHRLRRRYHRGRLGYRGGKRRHS